MRYFSFGYSTRAWALLFGSVVGLGCGSDDASNPQQLPQGVIPTQSGSNAAPSTGGAGRSGSSAMAPKELMPGLGTMMMNPGPGAPTAGTGPGARAAAGAGGQVTMVGSAGQGAAVGGSAGSQPAAGANAMAAGAGALGTMGAAGASAPVDMMDPTSVCAGGKVGMGSDEAMTRGMGGGRNLAVIMYNATPPNTVARFVTTLVVPKQPAMKSTLFIWPGLQHSGGADPGRVGNGVLQPVLTWGPSCAASAPAAARSYSSWWVSAMYVNVSTSAAGPTGCAGGDSMEVAVGDRLVMEFFVKGNDWTQTVTNLSNMKKVDFTIDLKGQDQNWVIWDIEVPSSARPAEDTIFEKSVLTFTQPVTSCQPSSAAEVDFFSAPVLSPDGMHCCYDKLILKQMRN